MNDNDILIALIGYLEGQGEKPFNLTFQDAEAYIGLPEGSVKKHIDAAAEKAGLKIDIKGETSARLLPDYPMPFTV